MAWNLHPSKILDQSVTLPINQPLFLRVGTFWVFWEGGGERGGGGFRCRWTILTFTSFWLCLHWHARFLENQAYFFPQHWFIHFIMQSAMYIAHITVADSVIEWKKWSKAAFVWQSKRNIARLLLQFTLCATISLCDANFFPLLQLFVLK